MSLSESLEELFSMISVMASKILTISDLEKAINNWKLDNTSDVNMYRSLTHLIDLLKRSSEHRDRDAPLHNPEIFRQAITRIQRDSSLPMQLSKSLNEARLKIRDTDSMPELNNILVGCMNQYIGAKPRNQKPQNLPKTHKVNIPFPMDLVNTAYPPPNVFQMVSPQTQQQGKAPQTSKKPAPNQGGNNGKKPQMTDGKQGQGGAKPKGGQGQTQGKGKSFDNNKKPFKKWAYVEPWPEGKSYVSKSGNALSKELEEHFKDFCFRCGHNSHPAERCKIYPDKTTVMTLCKRCSQGFHESCKSRRYGLKEEQITKQLQQVQHMFKYLCTSTPLANNPAITALLEDSDDD
jgi:hypothetical protein